MVGRGVDGHRVADTGARIGISQDVAVGCGVELIVSAAMATRGQLSALNVALLCHGQ